MRGRFVNRKYPNYFKNISVQPVKKLKLHPDGPRCAHACRSSCDLSARGRTWGNRAPAMESEDAAEQAEVVVARLEQLSAQLRQQAVSIFGDDDEGETGRRIFAYCIFKSLVTST
eukprot:SAG22_NODE_951_length_6344_cov_2.683747_7_plen_115_part_00